MQEEEFQACSFILVPPLYRTYVLFQETDSKEDSGLTSHVTARSNKRNRPPEPAASDGGILQVAGIARSLPIGQRRPQNGRVPEHDALRPALAAAAFQRTVGLAVKSGFDTWLSGVPNSHRRSQKTVSARLPFRSAGRLQLPRLHRYPCERRNR